LLIITYIYIVTKKAIISLYSNSIYLISVSSRVSVCPWDPKTVLFRLAKFLLETLTFTPISFLTKLQNVVHCHFPIFGNSSVSKVRFRNLVEISQLLINLQNESSINKNSFESTFLCTCTINLQKQVSQSPYYFDMLLCSFI
jgi:hypothetical protein